MYLLPPGPQLLSELCIHVTSSFSTGTFWALLAIQSIHRRGVWVPSQLPYGYTAFPPLSDDRRKVPLAKNKLLRSGLVVQLLP